MSINVSDPLALLPYQNGLADPVLVEGAAEAAGDLTAKQRAYKIGDPVPIVFCRRVGSNGGVLVSPGATEGRYQNDATTNELTVSLHLVLSEGDLPTIPIKDVFAGPCRQGTWDQNYDRRSGLWTPGNLVTTVAGKTPWACPFYCGTGGRYEDMTTLSYVNSFPDGSDRWDQQVHVFVRQGIKVTRIIDSTLGPSNNVIDLALYLMNSSGRIPPELIDNAQMLAAANFCETNGFYYDGVFKESLNLDEWLEQIGNDFLLRLVEIDGKFGFKPRLPVNQDNTINTSAVDWLFTFTEEHLLPDGFEIQYIPLEDRKPVCLQMMWRQQPDSDIGFARTTEVRYTGEAPAGPFEQYDLSQFCTNETHAVKVAAYRLARKKYITHTLRLNVRPASYNSTLKLGNVVRVRLRRETATAALSYHDFLYEIDRIEKTAGGACVFDLTQLPIDDQGRSLVALDVVAATAAGVQLSSGRSNFICDENESDDETPLGGTGTTFTPNPDDTSADIPQPIPGDNGDNFAGGGSPPIGPNLPDPIDDNPPDPLEEEPGGDFIIGASGVDGSPGVGDELSVPEEDYSGQVCFYRLEPNGDRTLLGCQDSYKVTTADIGSQIEAEGEGAADPSTSSGTGPAISLGTTKPVVNNIELLDTTRQKTYVLRIEYFTDSVRTQCASPFQTFTSSQTTELATPFTITTFGVRINGDYEGNVSSPCGDTQQINRNARLEIFNGTSWSFFAFLWGGGVTTTTGLDESYGWGTYCTSITIDGVEFF